MTKEKYILTDCEIKYHVALTNYDKHLDSDRHLPPSDTAFRFTARTRTHISRCALTYLAWMYPWVDQTWLTQRLRLIGLDGLEPGETMETRIDRWIASAYGRAA